MTLRDGTGAIAFHVPRDRQQDTFEAVANFGRLRSAQRRRRWQSERLPFLDDRVETGDDERAQLHGTPSITVHR
jgi:hypothetical protein